MRVLLGIFEAGLFPGCVYLISMYYKRFELQWRLSLFFSGSILAGGFGGLFAYALANMAGVAGYGGWRWIFIIEGLITIVVAAIGKIWVANWPGTATFLNQEERMYLAARLHEDDKGATMNRLDKRSLKRIFSDWKIYVGGVMYFGVVNTGYAGSVSPSILVIYSSLTAAIVLHSNHYQPIGILGSSRPSSQHTNLRCRCHPLRYSRLDHRPNAASVLLLHARNRHFFDRLHPTPSTEESLSRRPLLRSLPRNPGWLHHPAHHPRLGAKWHGWALQARCGSRIYSGIRKLGRHSCVECLPDEPGAKICNWVWYFPWLAVVSGICLHSYVLWSSG